MDAVEVLDVSLPAVQVVGAVARETAVVADALGGPRRGEAAAEVRLPPGDAQRVMPGGSGLLRVPAHLRDPRGHNPRVMPQPLPTAEVEEVMVVAR